MIEYTDSNICSSEKKVYFINRDLICRIGSNYGLTEDVILALAKIVQKNKTEEHTDSLEEPEDYALTEDIEFMPKSRLIRWKDIEQSFGEDEFNLIRVLFYHRDHCLSMDDIEKETKIPALRKTIQNIMTRSAEKMDKLNLALSWAKNCVKITTK